MWFDPQTLLARSYPPATSATFEVQAGTKVAESQKSQPAANDAALDPDSYCWPHSSAMNTAEINRMALRIGMFQRRGLELLQAEALADRCMLRDREIDDRRACVECKHLQASGTCAAKQAALPKTMFHRCHKFGWQVPRS